MTDSSSGVAIRVGALGKTELRDVLPLLAGDGCWLDFPRRGQDRDEQGPLGPSRQMR